MPASSYTKSPSSMQTRSPKVLFPPAVAGSMTAAQSGSNGGQLTRIPTFRSTQRALSASSTPGPAPGMPNPEITAYLLQRGSIRRRCCAFGAPHQSRLPPAPDRGAPRGSTVRTTVIEEPLCQLLHSADSPPPKMSSSANWDVPPGTGYGTCLVLGPSAALTVVLCLHRGWPSSVERTVEPDRRPRFVDVS